MDSSDKGVTLPSVKFGLAHLGSDAVLATSEQGQSVRSRLEREITSQPSGAPIELDFAGVHAVTVTFADECIGRILSSRLAGYDEDHPIFAVNAVKPVRDTLAAALRQRHLSLLSFSTDGVELLGADETLEETIREAIILKSFTVNELADRLGLRPQAANNRLVQLVRLGALTRSRVIPSRGGREFRYQVPRTPRARRSPVAA